MSVIYGRIIKSLSGFYYVEADNTIYECKARGNIRKSEMIPLTGDFVEISVSNSKTGIIENVSHRKNCFIRPAVSNVDAIVFVASDSIPVTDPFLIDRLSVIAVKNKCEFIVCVNKSDLTGDSRLFSMYEDSPFPTVLTSCTQAKGIDELLKIISGKTCVFTGNSGVGKSSLINSILPEANIPVDDVSIKLGRGKHTTRQVSLYRVSDDTFIADSPGFASFEVSMVSSISKTELQDCFPEFPAYSCNCRFIDCLHKNEPGCEVKEAVLEGKIISSRYESYLRLLESISGRESW